MTIDDKITVEKLHYDTNRGGNQKKASALSSCRINKYEYITGEKILSPDQCKIIEKAEFMYYPLGKPLEKQIKTIETEI